MQMQIAPSGIFLFRLLLNKALPLDVLFCFFGVFSLNLAPFGSGFISFHFLILNGKQLRVSSHRVIRMLVIQRIMPPTTSLVVTII